MTKWTDTRAGRPAGTYLVAGVAFESGAAETESITPGVRALFHALGIVEAADAPEPDVDESDHAEGAVVADDPTPEIAERVGAAEDAKTPEAKPTRSRGAK